MKSMNWMMLGVLAFGFSLGLGLSGDASARIAKCAIDPECMASCDTGGSEGQWGSYGDCLRLCCVPT